MLTQEEIAARIDTFELLAQSSNQVYRFTCGGEGYILKRSWMQPEQLSPFWAMLKTLFGSTFQTQRAGMRSLTALLGKNPHMRVVEWVDSCEAHAYQLFKEAQGLRYEPDLFPQSEALEYQLGCYVGFLHAMRFDAPGCYPPVDGEKCDFTCALHACMEALIKAHWQGNEAVRAAFERIRGVNVTPCDYSPIMPDISANQFLYAPDFTRISAVVDLDAYVIGPREWELCVLEYCMERADAFICGYSRYQPLPVVAPCRETYRLMLYLCDPYSDLALESHMAQPTVFA